MLELLAQARQQSWLLDVVENLARTPITTIILFAGVCSVIRVGIHYYIANADPLTKESLWTKFLRIIHDLSDALVYAGVLVFLIVRPFALQTFRIPTESMVPTLKVGDLIIVNKAVYRYSEPKAGDIVVFKPPAFARAPEDDPNIDFVKRMLGTPGQLIEIKNRRLFRDGVEVSEPYLNTPTPYGFQAIDFKLVEYPKNSGNVIPIVRDASHNSPGRSIYDQYVKPEDYERVWSYPAQKVPANKYLMVGDNRDGSFDGRFWGLINRRDIVGKAWITFWPLSRFGGADKRP
jgi:signal peptidase I